MILTDIGVMYDNFLAVRVSEVQWLDQQQPRHAQEGDQQENRLH